MWSVSTILQLVFFIYGILKLVRWFVRRNWKSLDLTNEINVKGKIVLITGANAGIGKITALELADRDAHVILACRDETRAKNAIKWIREKTGRGVLTFMKLDLSSLDSTRQFCKDYQTKYDKIDILINNAGLVVPENKMYTRDGFELHMGVNHLGHFLLTNLLLDLVKKGAPSRIVTVSSMAHSWAQLDLDDLMCDKKEVKNASPFVPLLYANSKLANVLFNKELAKRLVGTGVNCYSLCPGMVDTDIGKDFKKGPMMMIFNFLVSPIFKYVLMKTPEEGAETTIYCALNKDLSNQTGEMYRNCTYWEPTARIALRDEDAQNLWKQSEKLVGLI